MNKSIVYFFVLSSFLIGCGQGFQGNLSPAKDLAPFDEQSGTQQQTQDTDTTRPNTLTDDLSPSSDEEGMAVVYNIDESADGNYNNTVNTDSMAFYLDQIQSGNSEIAVQGTNWSQNQKPTLQQAQVSVTNETTQQTTETESTEVETISAHESVTQDTPGKPQNELADSPIPANELNNNPALQQAVQEQSKCNMKLLDNHISNINQHVQYYTKALNDLDVSTKLYRFRYTINCEKLAFTAGAIYNNYKKIVEAPLYTEIRYGRGGRMSLRQAIAKLVKYKTTVNMNGPVDIRLNLYDSYNPNNKSRSEITNSILKNPGIKIPISGSEKDFQNWKQAVRDAVLKIK